MLQKFRNIIIVFISASFLAIVQFSFFSILPSVFQFINIGIITLTLLTFFLGKKSALFFLLVYGLFLDFLSFSFFGLQTISLALAILAVAYVLDNFLTNKSFYSLSAAAVIFTLVYNLSLAILTFLSSGFTISFALSKSVFYLTLLWQIIWGILAIALLFSPLVILARRFKPLFLIKFTHILDS